MTGEVEAATEPTPLGRVASTDEVAAAVGPLVGPEATVGAILSEAW